MRWAVNLLKAMLAVLVLLTLGAYVLPDRLLVERQRVIAVSADRLWPLIAQPRQWPRWSPWHARDPSMSVSYAGAESGAGAAWSWRSATQGQGRVRFDSAQMPARLVYTLTFDDAGPVTTGEFRLESVAGGTRVTWGIEARTGHHPMLRWLMLLAERGLASDLDAGLERLAHAAMP
jgi:uncharacterized protein YndB with AHSA1/START domain